VGRGRTENRILNGEGEPGGLRIGYCVGGGGRGRN